MNFNNIKEETELLSKSNDELVRILTDEYIQRLDAGFAPHTMDRLTAHQHTLLGYRFFSEEINQGGFVQLIQNGYGGYIFDNPFAKSLKLYGARELGKLVYKAKKIYDAHREDLERERTDDEFMAMYVDYEVFDELEEQYFFMEEEQLDIVAQYVRLHIAEFLFEIL